ncbi:MAG: preprotein translocase subunit YajC [Clostridia bacterium]|nr:preprotein translocase subunit YajC [Clostridia bacterium]
MLPSLIMLVLMFAVFYFILIRPQKKKEKELRNMLASLKVNDEVATIGGIHGKIVRIKDDLFVLESGIGQNKSYITVDRSAVSRFMKRGEEAKAATPIPGEIAENTEAAE